MPLFNALLPDGWVWEPLGRHYRITKKPRQLGYAQYTRIPFAPMDSVAAGGKAVIRYEFREPNAISSGTYFEREDVLLAKITPSFENGKQGKADDLTERFGIASTELIPLQPIDGSDAWYLFYYLLHPEVRGYLAGKMEGSTARQRVPDRALLELAMPMPPPEEQAAITAVLGLVQRAREVEEQLVATTRELKQAAMEQLFARGLRGEEQKETNVGPVPESWRAVAIGELGGVVTGTTPRTAERRYYDGGSVPFIAPGDLGASPWVNVAEKSITEAGLAVSRSLPSKAICFVCIGSSIGKVGITTAERSATNQQINAVVVSKAYDPTYVFYLLSVNAKYVATFASPSPVPILSKGGFERINLFLSPDIEEQKQIGSALAAIDRMAEAHARKREVLAELFETLLHDLMTGRVRVPEAAAAVAAASV